MVQKKIIADLKRKESGSLADIIELNLKEYGKTMITLAELARLMAYSAEELEKYLQDFKKNGNIILFHMKKDIYLWHSENEYIVRKSIKHELQKYHEAYPYRYGMKKAQLYTIYMKNVKINVFDMYIEFLTEIGDLERKEEYIYLSTFQILKDERYQAIQKIYTSAFQKAQFNFLHLSEIEQMESDEAVLNDIMQLLIDEGTVIHLNNELYTLYSIIKIAADRIKEYLVKQDIITIAQVRDMFGTSRKNAKLILEYTDNLKITKRIGAESERVSYKKT